MVSNANQTESSESADKDLTGLRKVAAFLVAIGSQAAGELMRHMDREIVEDLSREIASLGVVPQEHMQGIVEEFYNVALAKHYAAEGGLSYARMVLEHAIPKDEASHVMQQIEHQVHQQPFSFLQKTESENLLTFIQDEHPQTIALILAHLPEIRGSEILSGLAPDKQREVVTRVANMEQTNPEVIREVEKGLEQRLSGIVSQQFQRAGGVEMVAEILNLSDRTTEKGILESLESEDPDLVEQIRRLMFVFEDILLVNDKGIQAVLKEVDQDELSLALKTASEEMKEKIFSNMSERASLLIKEEMEYMGPVRLSDVEAAQQRIVDVVRRLEDAGDIIIEGRGGEENIVV
jgi:flagellar motor switch protein FliG